MVILFLQILPTVHLEDHHVIKKRAVNQPLRIKLYYDPSVYR